MAAARAGIFAILAIVATSSCKSGDPPGAPIGATSAARGTPSPATTSGIPPTTSTTVPAATSTTTISTTVVTTTTTLPLPPPAGQLATVGLTVVPWADVPMVTAMEVHPVDRTPYAASQTGEVWRLADPASPQLALDLTAEVSPYENGSERGLLGLGFSPVDGRMFVFFTDHEQQAHLVSFAFNPTGRPIRRRAGR